MKTKADHDLFDKILTALSLRASSASLMRGGAGDGAWVRGFVAGITDASSCVDRMRGHRGADEELELARKMASDSIGEDKK